MEQYFFPSQVPVGGRLRSECSGKGTGKLSVSVYFFLSEVTELMLICFHQSTCIGGGGGGGLVWKII